MVSQYHKTWEDLIPTHLKIQFAGNMGFMSFGTGWNYGNKHKWETDVFVGFIPKFDSKKNKTTMTVKQNYIPWNIKLKDGRFSLDPITCGIYANLIYGDDYWITNPDRYPKGYYGFASKVRFNAFVGQRLTFKKKFLTPTFYYEFSISDIMLANAITNLNLHPKDYLSLSFGLKFQIYSLFL